MKMQKIGLSVFVLAFQTALFGTATYGANSASLTFGCAPWDGRALDLKISAANAMYKISVWDQGYDDLVSGKRTLLIDNLIDNTKRRSFDSTIGSAYEVHDSSLERSKKKFTPITFTLHFDELDLKEGGKASGWVQKLDGTKYTFQGAIKGRAYPCG